MTLVGICLQLAQHVCLDNKVNVLKKGGGGVVR